MSTEQSWTEQPVASKSCIPVRRGLELRPEMDKVTYIQIRLDRYVTSVIQLNAETGLSAINIDFYCCCRPSCSALVSGFLFVFCLTEMLLQLITTFAFDDRNLHSADHQHW